MYLLGVLYWRANEASETLFSHVYGSSRYIYICIYIYIHEQGKLLQSVTGQMSHHICSVSAHFFPGLTKLADRNNLPLIEMIECLAN